MYKVEPSIVVSDSDLVEMVSKQFNLSWNEVRSLREIEELFDNGYYVGISVDSLERLQGLYGEKLGFVFYELAKANNVNEIYCYFDN